MADNRQSDNRKVYLPPIILHPLKTDAAGSNEEDAERRRVCPEFAISPKKRPTKSNQSSVSDSFVLPRIRGSSDIMAEFEGPLRKSRTLLELASSTAKQSSKMTTSKSCPALTQRNFDSLANASIDFPKEIFAGQDAGAGFRASKTRTISKRHREDVNGGLKLPLICLSSSSGITDPPNLKRNARRGVNPNAANHHFPDSFRFENMVRQNETTSPNYTVGGLAGSQVGASRTAAEDISSSNDKHQAKRCKNAKASNSQISTLTPRHT